MLTLLFQVLVDGNMLNLGYHSVCKKKCFKVVQKYDVWKAAIRICRKHFNGNVVAGKKLMLGSRQNTFLFIIIYLCTPQIKHTVLKQ